MNGETITKTIKNNSKQERQKAIESLKRMIKENDVIYTILRQVNKNGTRKKLSILVIKDNNAYDITYLVAKATNFKVNENNYIVVDGYGFDAGNEVVYWLSLALFNDGYKLKHKWL